MLENGRGTERDGAAALALYRRAGEQGNVYAQARLAAIFDRGLLGATPDATEAVRWARLAAAQNDAGAQLTLAIMYEHGRGVEKNGHEAIVWFRTAAAQGNAAAELDLGNVYWEGSDGEEKDHAEAMRHYLVAADKGQVGAQRMVATAYRTGDGLAQDMAKMLYWSRKCAEQGDPTCANSLGYSILIGLDGTYDFVESVTWLILAVERAPAGEVHDRAVVNLGNAKAQLNEQELAEAEKRAQAWREKFGPAPVQN
jgi:uncharacterized protein